MAHGSSGWLRESAAVLAKDLSVEYRTRYALSAIAMFAVTTLVAVSFATGQQANPQIQAALLWIVLFFAALSGLVRTFVAEEDGRTADLLRLSASPTSVYLGKLAFNLLLLLGLAVVLVPGFQVFMAATVRDPLLLAASLLTGCWGMAAVLTFTSALVAQSRAKGSLAAVVSFPLVAPLLKLAIDAAAAAFLADPKGWAGVQGLAAYAGIMTVVAILLFDVVWNA